MIKFSNENLKFVLFSITIFFCCIGFFVRQSLFGFDSYAWKSFVCTGWDLTLGANPLALYFFDLMPCSLLFFKLVMLASLVLSLWFVFLALKEFYDERLCWQAVFLLVALSPIVLFEFGK